MKNKRILIPFAFCLWWFPTVLSASSNNAYLIHQQLPYEISLPEWRYPGKGSPQKNSDKKSPGQIFQLVSPDGRAQVRHWKKMDVENVGWKGEYQRQLDSLGDTQITYRIFKLSFFVISGLKDGEVYYLKVIPLNFGGQLAFGNFEMRFPLAEKAKWDPVLAATAKSFKPKGEFKVKATLEPFTEKDLSMIHFYDKGSWGRELDVLAAWFQWDKDEKEKVERFVEAEIYQARGIGGNAGYYASNEEVDKWADEQQEQVEESIREKVVLGRKAEPCFRGREKDFLEWFYENEEITKGRGFLNEADGPGVDHVGWSGTRPFYFREQEMVGPIMDDIRVSAVYRDFQNNKYQEIKDPDNRKAYFELWEKLLKDKIFFIYDVAPYPGPSKGGEAPRMSDGERERLQKEMIGLARRMVAVEEYGD